jgi:hypothetical protein
VGRFRAPLRVRVWRVGMGLVTNGSCGELLGVGLGRECDLVSERFEPANETFGEPVGVMADEVVAAEVAEQLSGLEHVTGGGEDRVADRGHPL